MFVSYVNTVKLFSVQGLELIQAHSVGLGVEVVCDA